MEQTPKANRVHIGFFGRCNAGKSTLINMLTDQPVSLVSDVAGSDDRSCEQVYGNLAARSCSYY